MCSLVCRTPHQPLLPQIGPVLISFTLVSSLKVFYATTLEFHCVGDGFSECPGPKEYLYSFHDYVTGSMKL